jgi:hypothetical protein
MAGEATVEESAMLQNRVTNQKREVDVVITGKTAGHEVIVSVEASSTRRPASIEWVERTIGKHADLPTDRLVLVSERGFAKGAREYAEAKGVAAIAPEDMASGDPAFTVVNRLPSIWPKTVSFTPQSARLYIHVPGVGLQWFRAMPDHIIFFEDGHGAGTVMDMFRALHDANAPRIFDQIGLGDIAEDMTSEFVFRVGPPWTARVEGKERHFFARYDDADPPEYHLIDRLEVTGTMEIKVIEVSLEHRKLGDVMYAYGEGTVGGKQALILFTEGEQGDKATLRLREEGQAERDIRLRKGGDVERDGKTLESSRGEPAQRADGEATDEKAPKLDSASSGD